MKSNRFLAVLGIFCVLTFHLQAQTPKYIFYFIGDGFGLSQSLLAENYLDAIHQDTQTVHLQMLNMPETGFSTTYSANSYITCSSAAGTALATGVKTNNDMLGVTPQGKPLRSIAEFLHQQGFLIGLVSTVSLDHATPAAFYANSKSRSSYEDIARQLLDADFDFYGGGGLKGAKNDPDFWKRLKSRGYLISDNPQEIEKHTLKDGKLYAKSALLMGEQDIPYRFEAPDYKMHLSYYVKQMIRLFEPEQKPFFAMIEGGKIDWAGHDNDAAAMLHEVLELDSAYQAAYQFYLRHPDETLIILTADHETGGLAIGTGTMGYAHLPQLLSHQKLPLYKFQAQMKELVDAESPLSDIYKCMEKSYGFNTVPELELKSQDSARIEADTLWKDYTANQWAILCNRLFCNKLGIGWTTGSHTGVAVPVRAIGAGAENFRGFYTNSDIPLKILQLLKYKSVLN